MSADVLSISLLWDCSACPDELAIGSNTKTIDDMCVVKSHVSIIVQENTGHFFVASDPRRKASRHALVSLHPLPLALLSEHLSWRGSRPYDGLYSTTYELPSDYRGGVRSLLSHSPEVSDQISNTHPLHPFSNRISHRAACIRQRHNANQGSCKRMTARPSSPCRSVALECRAIPDRYRAA